MNGTIVVGLKEDVLEGGRVVVDVDGLEIGIFRVDGRLYAWENRCVHAGGPVCQGKLMPRVVERLDAGRRSLGDDFADELHIVCPWHGYEYDVRTGEHPADARLRLPFLMQRLDHEYLKRTSEAPLLKRPPSEYMREMFYTSQPMEMDHPALLESTLIAINAETQLVYASDWPLWDFDVPAPQPR